VVVRAGKGTSAQGAGMWADLLDAATMAFAPLHSNGQTLGILVVCHRTPYDYQPQESDILRVGAALASGGVARLPLDEGGTRESSKSQLFSVLSHELRTPLTSIMGFTQLIRKRISASEHADPRTMEQLDVLWAQAHRLNRLIDTFVDMARIERGEFEIVRGKVELTGLIKSAAEQAVAQASSHHTINVDVPDEALWLHGDSKRLEQAFNHVISNAVRYSPQSHPIQITCKEDADRHTVTIKVADRGPGIPASRLKEIFDRNYPSGPLKSGGLGIGLFLSKVIVEAHGGQISIVSASGKGTTVSIVLPV
jgi:signal transduction histidine kinase